jgi:hypothetical protein
MGGEKRESTIELGTRAKWRTNKYFCVDDEECHAFAKVSKEARILKRTAKRIQVMGKEVAGWIVEIEVPATDGVVRVDPLAERDRH